MSGLVDELQAAGRAKVAEWSQSLGLLALRAHDRMRGYEAVATALRGRGGDGMFAFLRESYAEAMATSADALASAERERRERLNVVREWLYSTLGELSDIDTHDAYGASEGLGALPAVPAAVVAILAGLGVAAYVAHMEYEDRAEERSYSHRQWLVEQCAAGGESETCRLAKVELAREHERRDDGLPWWAWVLIALGLASGGAVVALKGRGS